MGNSKQCKKYNVKNIKSAQSHSLNPTKATNAIEKYERKNRRGDLQVTPSSRSNSFPSHRGDIDIDILSLSLLTKICKNHWRV
jgi:hypothetical protein